MNRITLKIGLIGVFVLGLLLLGVPVFLQEIAPCDGISWRWNHPIINLHASDRGEVRINGKNYGDLLGFPPFFLTDIDCEHVLFVKRAADRRKMIVVCDLKGKSVSEYRVDGANSIGSEIGASGLNGAWERIESIDNDSVVIKQRHDRATITYT